MITARAKKGTLVSGYLVLAVLVAVGLGMGIVRLIDGLGSATNLSDGYPWGLWIVYDVFFIPFSAGAFMISAVTHIYNRKEYHPIARPVILAGFLGYVFVVVILLMDLGRWHKFYNILIPWYWNLHSFMFEVSMCVTLYSGILIMEVAPAIFERLNWQKPLRAVRALTVLVASAGIVLSSLHQSSLGSLFLLMPYKLHPLWWTPLLPLLFFTSAAFGGLAMAIFVAVVSFRAFRHRLEFGLLTDLARIVSMMLGVYLVLKVGDLILAGEIGLIFSPGWPGLLFLAEMVIGVIVPMVLFGRRKVRESGSGLVWGAACVLVGLALNRTSVALLAQSAPAGAAYFPHWIEIAIVVAAIAAGVLIFALAARFLPVLPDGDPSRQSIVPSSWSRPAVILIGGALSLLTIAVVLWLEPVAQARATKVEFASTPLQDYVSQEPESCYRCHLDQTALLSAGAAGDELARLTIEPQPPQTPHGRLRCVTCHQGIEGVADVDAAHAGLIVDPSQGYSEVCLSCHPELPDEFPQDRLRTPHNKVVHGQAANVFCSDCHGGVGHGFDPVSGKVICPMSVCLDCHQARQIDSQLGDCNVCHIGPHEAEMAMDCVACHQSTQVWQEIEFGAHPVELVDRHAEAQCFDCHQKPDFAGLQYTCSNCHQRPHDLGNDDCAGCHSPAADWTATGAGEEHPFPQDHGGMSGNCTLCHPGGDTTTYACQMCHSQNSIQQIHETKGLKDVAGKCVLCHPQGQKP
jgi:Ni/Fe-hydrogenase subunit HybB-like protein